MLDSRDIHLLLQTSQNFEDEHASRRWKMRSRRSLAPVKRFAWVMLLRATCRMNFNAFLAFTAEHPHVISGTKAGNSGRPAAADTAMSSPRK